MKIDKLTGILVLSVSGYAPFLMSLSGGLPTVS